jgi:hypothetical protein
MENHCGGRNNPWRIVPLKAHARRAPRAKGQQNEDVICFRILHVTNRWCVRRSHHHNLQQGNMTHYDVFAGCLTAPGFDWDNLATQLDPPDVQYLTRSFLDGNAVHAIYRRIADESVAYRQLDWALGRYLHHGLKSWSFLRVGGRAMSCQKIRVMTTSQGSNAPNACRSSNPYPKAIIIF